MLAVGLALLVQYICLRSQLSFHPFFSDLTLSLIPLQPPFVWFPIFSNLKSCCKIFSPKAYFDKCQTQVPWSEHCDSLPASKGVQNEDGDDHGHWSMTMKLVKKVMINNHRTKVKKFRK